MGARRPPPRLSHSTVKHHLANARSKVGAETTAQLVWILGERLPEPEGASQGRSAEPHRGCPSAVVQSQGFEGSGTDDGPPPTGAPAQRTRRPQARSSRAALPELAER